MISGEAKLAGVMGWPVAHSRSPRLHGYWLEKYRIDGAYLPLPVAPEHFSQALRVLANLGFRGVNVTVPHKEEALAAVDTADAQARLIGAVNTVIMREDGSLEGRNTDGIGFLAQLKDRAPGWLAPAGPAVVIGSGGAARAIVATLKEAGVPEIRLVNRTLARAEALAMAFGGPLMVVPWINRVGALRDAAIVVNCSTLGMHGQPDLDLELTGLKPGAAVFDCVYSPLETPLLAQARRKGLVPVDGLGMLIHQARPGFKAWFGIDPEITDDLRALVAQGL